MRPAAAAGGGWRAFALVFAKEWRDALRDRRTLAMVLLSAVAMGPVVLVVLSMLVAGIEQRAEARELQVVGLAGVPSLDNWLRRQALLPREAPPDWEQQLRERRLADAVLVPAPDFEAALAAGRRPAVEVVVNGGDLRGAAARWERLLAGFSQEQGLLRLAMRGVAPALLQGVEVDRRELAEPRARAAQFTGLLPYFVLVAVLYGALHAALDTTAGERERGSLEPLLVSPVARGALVAGKWAAVAAVGLAIATLCSIGFLPAQWLLRSETLAALFDFGWRDALGFVGLLLPMAALLPALLMAIAMQCRSVKEAQANTTVVMLAVSLLPLVTLLGEGREAPWQRWVPALSQVALMNRLLRGEPLPALDVLASAALPAVLTVLCLAWVARHMREAGAAG